MRITNITPVQDGNRDINKQVSYKGSREIVRTLADPDSLMTTVVLESFVTGGRSANAYKRGGFPEFRECFTDNLISAVFWMKGVDIFNKIGDSIGKNILKLPTTEFDVGKDALRAPFDNLIHDLGEKSSDPEMTKKLAKKLSVFKFSKIIISTILATSFIGFALPKINQAITRMMMGKKGKEKKNKPETYSPVKDFSFEQFEKHILNKKEKSQDPTFKGIQPGLLTAVAHNLESQPIVKMLTNDLGILSGRVLTSRNPDEGVEFLFRDTASSFFYFASTPIVYKLLQKVSNSSNLTSIDPVAAKQITEQLIQQLKNADGSFASMPVDEFKKKTMGTMSEKAKELLSKLPFNSDVITLDALKNHIKDENLIKKASEMAKLQPKKGGINHVLTKQQVMDVLKDGSINTPEFMQNIYGKKFGSALTDPYKYISMKKITKFRTNIDDYIQAVLDTAKKKNNGIIDKSLIENLNKKSHIMSGLFRVAAIAVSAVALGIVIPKLQYKLTEKRTGSNAAPGLREFEQSEIKQDKKAL
ncbi:MAG: hypothetical protein ACI37R_05630 [Candidatus Avigastranaerophilus sp.]